MCFSAAASFTTATLTAGIGIATLRQVKHWRELPLASIALLFAFQQGVEGALWLKLSSGDAKGAVAALSLAFLIYAKVFWPAYAGLAVLLIEPDDRRKQALYVLTALGCTISIYVLHRLIENPPAIAIVCHSIDYGGNENALSWQSLVYILCTCVPFLLSSSRAVQNFGAFVLIGFAISAYAYFATFISVWCFFAAGGSSLLYFYFKHAAVRAPLSR